MKTIIFSSLIAFTSVFFTGCSAQAAELNKENEILASIQSINRIAAADVNLSDSEIEGVLLMREEEKMAHDVYVYFASKYNVPIFKNISAGETRHQEAMGWLINTYGLRDPTIPQEGKFTNAQLQQYYDKFISQGVTLVEALKVGACIEEYDIADLKKLINEAQNPDIIRIYTNLLRGSENHLKAFVKNLSFRGVKYEPQILTKPAFDLILQK